MKKAVFQIESLTCPSCINKIESTLNQQAGIGSAKVLYNLGRVKAEFDETLIKAAQIEATLKTLGYEVKSATVS